MGNWTLDQVRDTILWISSVIAAIGVIYTFITRPLKKHSAMIMEKLEKQSIAIAENAENIRILNEKADKAEEEREVFHKNDKFSLRCLATLVQHEATGNHINDMKKLYQEVRDYVLK